MKKYLFYYFLGQKPFLPFLKNKKNIKQILILNFLFGNCSFMEKESFWKLKKKYSFSRSLWFFENENFAARALIRRFFLIKLINIKPIDSNVPIFENHFTLLQKKIIF